MTYFRSKGIFKQSPIMKSYALRMREEPTPAEQLLWRHLQAGQRKQNRFVRQKIILGYIVDFYTNDSKVAIEVDGSQHYTEEGKKKDWARTKALNAIGIYVLHFSNDEVINNITEVCKKIDEKLTLKGEYRRNADSMTGSKEVLPGAIENCYKSHIGITKCKKQHRR